MPHTPSKNKPYVKEVRQVFDMRPLYVAMAWYGLLGETANTKVRVYVRRWKEHHGVR